MLQILGALSALALAALAAPLTDENAKWNTNTEKGDPRSFKGGWPDHQYHPSPKDWRQVSVYQLLTDRFRDADPINNEFKDFQGYDLRDHTTRHGGDFKGVIEKLDYIKGLGFDAIWISPVFQNEFNSYHGYAQIDFTLIDKRWGTLDDLRALTTAAHERDMYVIVDIVVNHMSNRFEYINRTTKKPPTVNKKGQTPFVMHKDEYELKWRRDTVTGKEVNYEDFKFNNTFYDTGLYPHNTKLTTEGKNPELGYYDWFGKSEVDSGALGEGGFWDSDFHHNGDLTEYQNTFTIHQGKIYGIMDDIRTESPDTRKKLIAMAIALILSADVDAFRLDTPMQVDLDFWKQYVPEVRAAAAAKNKNNFGFWGELFCNYKQSATFVGRGRAGDIEGDSLTGIVSGSATYDDSKFIDTRRAFDGGIDYMYGIWSLGILLFEVTEAATIEQANGGFGGVAGIRKIWEYQRKVYDFAQPSLGENKFGYEQWTFCNNHDRERIATTSCGKEKMEMCNTLFLFWPGMYTFYAGDEQMYANPGTALNGWAREELTTSISWVPISNKNNGDDFDMASKHYKLVARQLALRKKLWSSLECDEVKIHITPPETGENKWGILAFERSCEGSPRLLVVMNMDPTYPQDLVMDPTLMGWADGDTVVNLMNKNDQEYTFSGGVLKHPEWEKSLRNWGYLVLAKQVVVVPPVITEVSPGHDAIITLTEYISTKTRTTMPFPKAKFDINVTFSEKMEPDTVHAILHVRSPITGSTEKEVELQRSSIGEEGTNFTFELPPGEPALPTGIHEVSVAKTAKAAVSGLEMTVDFTSRIRVLDGNDSVLVHTHDTDYIVDHDLIEVILNSSDATGKTWETCTLHNSMPGAQYFRVRNSYLGTKEDPTKGDFTEWMPYTPTHNWPKCSNSISVIVQYYAHGSAAYFKADCKQSKRSSCSVSWYEKMHWSGEFEIKEPAEWATREMTLISDFTWQVIVEIWPRKEGIADRNASYKYNPAGDDTWSQGSYGLDPTVIDGFNKEQGLVTVQKWMEKRGRWPSVGVGKLQREGGDMSYNKICKPGTCFIGGAWGECPDGRPTLCTFRMSDLWLTFSECAAVGVCYMPGTKVPPADLKVDGDVCDTRPDPPPPAASYQSSTILLVMIGSVLVIFCGVAGLVMQRKFEAKNPRQFVRRSSSNVEMNQHLSNEPAGA